jgi:hypothetical protein
LHFQGVLVYVQGNVIASPLTKKDIDMVKKLFLFTLMLFVALPASFSIAQDDLTQTLELPDFGFTMSYPEDWAISEFTDESPFIAIAERERDLENVGDFASLRGQWVAIIPVPEDALEGDAGERLSGLAENIGGELRARDVEEVEIDGGYETSVGAPEFDDAFVVLAEVNGGEGFLFFLVAASPEDDGDDLVANLQAMLNTIEITEPGGGGDEDEDEDEDEDDGGSTEIDLGDAESIEYGDTVEGEITDDQFAIVYSFEGEEGDVVTITMVNASRSGGLDPFVQVVNEDGEVLAENDDADEDADLDNNLDSQIAEFELPEDGEYFIIATRFGFENGGSTGEFELTLEEGGGGGGRDEDEDADEDDGGSGGDVGEAEAIEYGDTVEGEITDDQFAVVYSFEGEEGDVVTITMVDTSRNGELDPYLILLDENGEVIAENDDAERGARLPDDLDSQIAEFELPEDGVYTIVATRYQFEDGAGEGEFELTLEGDN